MSTAVILPSVLGALVAGGVAGIGNHNMQTGASFDRIFGNRCAVQYLNYFCSSNKVAISVPRIKNTVFKTAVVNQIFCGR